MTRVGVGRLMTRFDPRLLIACGFAGFAYGAWLATGITKDWDFVELLIPQIFRGFSLMLCMVPINNLALGTMPPARMKNASGLFNVTRNLGGAVGLAMINTMINKRLDLHLLRLHETVRWGRSSAEETLASLTGAFASRGSDAVLAATKQLALIVRRDATVLALADVFLIVAGLSLAMIAVAPLMRRPAGARASGGH